MSQAPSERRGALRARADFPLRLAPTADGQPAQLQNISQTGLCCYFAEPLTEMAVMGIDLELPGVPGDEAHRIQGIVVRCDKRRGVNPPSYEVAIYFTELAPQTRKAIQGFVASGVKT